MRYFSLLRPLLYALPEETAHHLVIWALKQHLAPSAAIIPDIPSLHQILWGIKFGHPLGLAAGFDKNAEAFPALLKQGFSFVETGTVTPLPQPGNPKPRLFRLEEDEAIINRLGFNSKGADYFDRQLAKSRRGVVGINIGKNKDTENAAQDYLNLIQRFYGLGDYITVNISSPNTPGLRTLQHKKALENLLQQITECCTDQYSRSGKKIPLLLKIAPDLSEKEQQDIAEAVLKMKVDGMIVSNTTIGARERLKSLKAGEAGGLSGRPLFELSTAVLQNMYRFTEGKIPLVGVGGIFSGEDAYRKIRAGASLLQIYSAIIYHGLGIIPRILDELYSLLQQDGFTHLSQAVGADVEK